MSSWNGTSRSNIVLLKDEAALKHWKETLENTGMTLHITPEHPLCVWLEGDDDNGAFESTYISDEGEDVEIDYGELATHMADGQVWVLMSAGAEKLRYVTGWTQAYNSKGEQLSLRLSQIYELAKKEWGIDPTPAEYHTLPSAVKESA